MLGSVLRGLCVLLAAAVAVPCVAQETAKATLETSETMFSVLAAVNQCGYDLDLNDSDGARAQIRDEVAKVVGASEAAARAAQDMCRFYRDHQQADPARNLAQYISLALTLSDPPAFSPTLKEADMPPDASYVMGLVPILQKFYTGAELHGIWKRHLRQYEAMVEQAHDPVTKLLLQTDVYLRLPISGFVGRHFTIYLDPLAGPGQANARNYGTDYYLVIAPAANGELRLDTIRHTYLHFILDPLALKRANALARLQPLLVSVKTAPIAESFKNDISLLVTESLVRAVEARLLPGGRAAEAARWRAVEDSVREGFILTRHFYEQLVQFDKSEVGLNDAYGDWLHYIDVNREKKRAAEVEFAAKAAPEVLAASKPKPTLLAQAEARLAANDARGAAEFAQAALDGKQEDPARAFYILGIAATMNKDMQGAQNYFEKTIEAAREPFFVGRAHVYLGRIFDLKGEREQALVHYRAALAADSGTPRTKMDAEAGLKRPYEPPRRNDQ